MNKTDNIKLKPLMKNSELINNYKNKIEIDNKSVIHLDLYDTDNKDLLLDFLLFHLKTNQNHPA